VLWYYRITLFIILIAIIDIIELHVRLFSVLLWAIPRGCQPEVNIATTICSRVSSDSLRRPEVLTTTAILASVKRLLSAFCFRFTAGYDKIHQTVQKLDSIYPLLVYFAENMGPLWPKNKTTMLWQQAKPTLRRNGKKVPKSCNPIFSCRIHKRQEDPFKFLHNILSWMSYTPAGFSTTCVYSVADFLRWCDTSIK